MTKENFNHLFKTLVLIVGSIIALGLGVLTLSGKVAPWTGRFYSLLDPSYAKNNIPIIASVSEHQPTSWSSFYFDLQILTFLFPAGLYYCFAKLTDHNIFVILYGVTSVYFAVRHYIVHIDHRISFLNAPLLSLGGDGPFDVGFGSGHVYLIRNCRVSFTVDLHEILGRQSQIR